GLGIEMSELDPNGSFDRVLELAHFRSILRIAERKLKVPWEMLQARIRQDLVPSWLIQRAIRRHRALAARAEGGDLTDSYLLCVALFTDLAIVDKRTKENHRRAAQKEPETMQLLNSIASVSHYSQV